MTGRQTRCAASPSGNPEYGEEYRLDLTVYNGFGPGNENIHSHLRNDSHYREVQYVLDLSAYFAAGHHLAEEPQLHLYHEDVAHDELCNRRNTGAPHVPQVLQTGVYQWTFYDLREGFVDIAWQTKPPGAA